MEHTRLRHPRWLRRFAAASAALFSWSMVLSAPAAALAKTIADAPAPHKPALRRLSPQDMKKIVGSQLGTGHHVADSTQSGPARPWEGQVGGVNLGNGNNMTSIPLFHWTAKGGLPVALTLYNDSEGDHDSELAYQWTHSFDIWGTNVLLSSGYMIFQMPDDTQLTFDQNMDGSWATELISHANLTYNSGDNSFTVITKNQVSYHFVYLSGDTSTLYCSTITDANGNVITLAYTTSRYVSTVTDPTSRVITFAYADPSNPGKISSITDCNSRTWTMTYDTSDDLLSVTLPALAGDSTVYKTQFTYDTNGHLASLTPPRGSGSAAPNAYSQTFSYNSDGSTAWAKDALGNQTSFTYTSGSGTTAYTNVTDPNGNITTYTYHTGYMTQALDPLGKHTDFTWNYTTDNLTQVTDKRGYAWTWGSFDSDGNPGWSKDPYLNQTTYTWTNHYEPATITLPTGEITVNTYNTAHHQTQIDHKNSGGTVQATETYTVNSAGLTTDAYDANSHHTQYGYDANGNLSSVTTPLGNVTDWTYNALGVRATRVDALSRTTTYTLDNWERVTGVSYPVSTTNKTYAYDANSNLTQMTDVTGTTTWAYDNGDRKTSESHGGSTVDSYTYDATGKLGLLATETDSSGRAFTSSYTSRNELHTVSGVSGGTSLGTTTYTYDENGNQTGITNPNGTVVVNAYDQASRQTGVTSSNSSSTVLSSFSYTLNGNGEKTAVSELDGSMVSYGYDYERRLTSETRTGTNAYSISYTLNAGGNRTSQTAGTATTSFTYDSDDQLNSTASSTGGFVNSYSYNYNGEQTGRTLSGTAYTLAYDYEGQLTSITQGSNVTSFAYDGLGRRYSRTVGGGTATVAQYNGDTVVAEKQGTTTTASYSYGTGLTQVGSSAPLFDGLGSQRAVTNSSQSVTGTQNYDAFGNLMGSTGSAGSPFLYGAASGYRTDGDAGLQQVGARYYDAQVGRFITRDTYLNQHPYLYCEHDPVNYTDPTGHNVNDATGQGNTTPTVPAQAASNGDAPPGYHWVYIYGAWRLAADTNIDVPVLTSGSKPHYPDFPLPRGPYQFPNPVRLPGPYLGKPVIRF